MALFGKKEFFGLQQKLKQSEQLLDQGQGACLGPRSLMCRSCRKLVILYLLRPA
jgi:hypothetical protein